MAGIFISKQALANRLLDAGLLQRGFIANSCRVEGLGPARLGWGGGDLTRRATAPLHPKLPGVVKRPLASCGDF